MEDIIVEIITAKDVLRFYFPSYSEADEFVHEAFYGIHNADPNAVVKFCIRKDVDAKMP